MDEIQIEPYDAAWPAKFAVERELVLACLPRPPLAIEHNGSTAVQGLAAKPVIDIMVLVENLAEGRAAISALEAIGYSYWRDNPDTSKLFLAKGLPPAPRRTHHLHIYADATELERHLRFRDRLRADPAMRKAYQLLKSHLATEHRHDREAYTDGKSAFIDGAIAQASQD